MKRVRINVKGKVQGVNYRDFVRKNASMKEITGFVRNNRDKTVTIVAEGKETNIRDFVSLCKKGPLLAFVEDFDVKEEDATGEFESFLIES